MSIKQSILTLCLLFGVSFNALGVTVTYYGFYDTCGGPNVYADSLDSLGPLWASSTYCISDVVKPCVYSHHAYGDLYCTDARGVRHSDRYQRLQRQCDEGQIVDENGVCKDPTPFCSRPDTIQKMNDFASACAAQGDGYQSNIICRDDDEYLEMNCDAPPPPPDECTPDSPDWPNCKPPTECTPDSPDYPACCDESNNYCDNPPPEECTIFSPNWPECSGDTDIDPDTGDGLGDPDKPEGGGSGNPDPDKPEPDVEDNSEALGAISDLNKDMNNQLTAINNDLNKNHAESKSALDALKASIDLNTDTIVDGANHLQDSIEGQTKTLSDIGNKTNGLLTSANHLLKNGFSDLSGDLSDLKNSNEKGFGDVVNALDELGSKQVDGNQHGAPEGLYTSAEYNAMLGDVAQLKEEYKSVLNDFKRYFNFNSGVNSGEFNAHTLSLNWHGNSINQQNQVMTTLRDNAGIIAAVVLFCFGVAGIRVLVGAL
ncbi:chemotaxis protein [Vibrio parahaemolyticus]|uniref:chemotaxis protein n=1 Tax=Vibrio parahaemolyticus TaxID=670 RepID=UPI00235DCD7A|nr:chemotaxis protein [Vibrio parahaemolyticus]